MKGYKFLAKVAVGIAGPFLAVTAILSVFLHDPAPFLGAFIAIATLAVIMAYIHAVAWWLLN